MGGGYIVIAGALLYLLLVREAEAWGIRPKQAAATLIVGYYALRLIVLGIGYLIQESFSFDPSLVVVAAAQYGVAVVIFKKVEESGDEYLSYAFWGGLGLALIFFIVPRVMQSVMMML